LLVATWQRKHGQPAIIHPYKTVTDSRGHEVRVVDLDVSIPVVAVFIPQRSQKAELAGQQQIQVVRMIVRHDIPNFELWAQVEWAGAFWDVAAPPAYHHGTRHTRHISADLRLRPS
jgi:hypothetical protein